VRMKAAPDGPEGRHGRMPLIGSYVVDDQAVALINSWIAGTTSCP